MLKQLTSLLLDFSDFDQEWHAPGPSYSAITASSNLVNLVLAHGHRLPRGVWPHVFPAARKLLHLTALSLEKQFDGFEAVDPAVSLA
jgi:hypothetical protein